MSDLLSAQFEVISAAAAEIQPETIARYIELKVLLQDGSLAARKEFKKKFRSYYGLNTGGLTDRFRKVYFERLFDLRNRTFTDPPYAELLRELREIPRRKGDKVLPCSFVSKLIAIHDESRPLYDKYVSRFFGISAPQVGSLELRIAGFAANLTIVRQHYEAWTKDPKFNRLIAALRRRFPELENCHPFRICDFLVWQAGKLESNSRRQRRPGVNQPRKKAA